MSRRFSGRGLVDYRTEQATSERPMIMGREKMIKDIKICFNPNVIPMEDMYDLWCRLGRVLLCDDTHKSIASVHDGSVRYGLLRVFV